jgi:hypothetical protein
MVSIIVIVVHQQTMVSIIVIVVHQQTQWFPSLLLLYISRHNGFHQMEIIVSVDVQQ